MRGVTKDADPLEVVLVIGAVCLAQVGDIVHRFVDAGRRGRPGKGNVGADGKDDENKNC